MDLSQVAKQYINCIHEIKSQQTICCFTLCFVLPSQDYLNSLNVGIDKHNWKMALCVHGNPSGWKYLVVSVYTTDINKIINSSNIEETI